MKGEKTIGILLAGGLSSRYGSPKAFATLHGKYFYEYTYVILQAICEEVVIVTRPELLESFPENVLKMTDEARFAGCGPLAGIYSVMARFEAERYVVLPCDMPLLEAAVVGNLLDRHEKLITVVRTSKFLQPLVSVWNFEMKERIEAKLTAEIYKIGALFTDDAVHTIDAGEIAASDEQFINVNTREDEKEMGRWVK